MLIDASLGTACCCGPVPPVPPLPPTEPDALYVQMSTAQTAIARGAALPLAGTVRQFGNGLSYDTANHAVTVNETGVYAFDWNVLAEGGADGVVITLQSLDGAVLLATSGVPGGTADTPVAVSGHTVALLRAGTAWTLVNASDTPIDIPVAGAAPAVFAASLTVAQVGAQ
ncbi:MAG: hypothetical protein IKS42_10350 [Oscillospiraceae bacterium]|nr:hypothetical protein [Oscillospiraceae bacterium]